MIYETFERSKSQLILEQVHLPRERVQELHHVVEVLARRKAKSLGYRARNLMLKTRKVKILAEMSMNSRPEKNHYDLRKVRT